MRTEKKKKTKKKKKLPKPEKIYEPISEERVKIMNEVLDIYNDMNFSYFKVRTRYGWITASSANRMICHLRRPPCKNGVERKEKLIITPAGRHALAAERVAAAAVDEGLHIAVYMKAQYEQLLPFLKSGKAGHLCYPQLAMLISPKAKERVAAYRKRIGESFADRDEVHAEMLSLPISKSVGSIVSSALIFYQRLQKLNTAYGKLDESMALRELESLSRQGMISKIFVYSSPLKIEESEFLSKIFLSEDTRLSEAEKTRIMEERTRLSFPGVEADYV
jgi:hypothetical protein